MTTTSNARGAFSAYLSTRAEIILVVSRPSSRMTAERKDARFARDSISEMLTPGRTILIGIPGSPAPDPMSASDWNSGGSALRKRRLSRNKFSTIQSSSAEPIKRWDFCHFCNSFRYLPNDSSSVAARGRPRIEAAPDASASSAAVKPLPLGGSGAAPGPIHIPLLQDLEDVGDGPVEDQPGRQVQEHEREDERHDEHHLGLSRIAPDRRHLLLQEH